MSRSIRNLGQLDPVLVQNDEQLFELLHQQLQHNDILLTMGAGSIGNLALQITNLLDKSGDIRGEVN